MAIAAASFDSFATIDSVASTTVSVITFVDVAAVAVMQVVVDVLVGQQSFSILFLIQVVNIQLPL